MRNRIALQLPADFEAVHARHHHVKQHHVALRALADRQRIAAIHGGDDVEIFGGKPRIEQFNVDCDVIDYENTYGHGGSPSAEPRKWRMVSMNLPTEIGFER